MSICPFSLMVWDTRLAKEVMECMIQKVSEPRIGGDMKGEYENYELELGLPDGFSFERQNPRILGWKPPGEKWKRNPVISIDTFPIRMIVMVRGFYDFRNPIRNWEEPSLNKEEI